jgi:hypothetical protein
MKTRKNSVQADLEAICRNLGKRLPTKLRERVRRRAEAVREEIRKEHGVLDIGVNIIREMRGK